MAHVYNGVVQDLAGNALSGASVTVRNADDNTLATLFSDQPGTVRLANPFLSDSGGGITFYVTGAGTYDITATKGDVTREIKDVEVGISEAAGDMLGANNLSDVASKIIAHDTLTMNGSSIAAAATLNLTGSTGDTLDITGNTGITAITIPEGDERRLRFTGTPLITNGASLIIPGGNLQIVAGDVIVVRGYASSVVRVVQILKFTGYPVALPGVTNPLDAKVVNTAGRQTINIPALAMTLGASGSPAAATVQLASGTDYIDVLDFDGGGAKEYTYFLVAPPKGWDREVIRYQYRFFSGSSNSNTAVFGLAAAAVSDGDALAVTYGTAVEVSKANGGTANQLRTSSESGDVTVGGSPAALDLVRFRFYRDSNNGSDNMTEDARFVELDLFFNTNATNDA